MSIISKNELYIRINSSKKIKASEAIFILALSIYLINQMMYTTMFYVYMKNGVTTLINIVALCLIVFKITILDKYSLKSLALIGILFIFSNLAFLKSGYKELFYLSIFVIGVKDVDFKKICKVYLYIGVLITIAAMIAVKLNIIEHIVYSRNDKFRYSFGSVYPTDFAARIFFLCATYSYLKNEKLNLTDSIIFILIGSFTMYFCDARLDSISIFILSILPIISINIYNKKKYIGRVVKYILVLAVPVSAILSIVITNMYSPNNSFTVFLNQVFTGRLGQGKRGILEYGFSLFGQKVDMIGNGGVNGGVTNYFFIDSSYLYIALKYGVIMLFLICIYYLFFIRKRLKKGDILLPVLIVIVGINSIIAHHLIDIAYNPFVLVFFSSIYNTRSKTLILKNSST